MSVEIDMDKVTQMTVQQLGGQLAILTLELNATREANATLEAKVDRLEAQVTYLESAGTEPDRLPSEDDYPTGEIKPVETKRRPTPGPTV